jgi:hypothetical protein
MKQIKREIGWIVGSKKAVTVTVCEVKGKKNFVL